MRKNISVNRRETHGYLNDLKEKKRKVNVNIINERKQEKKATSSHQKISVGHEHVVFVFASSITIDVEKKTRKCFSK